MASCIIVTMTISLWLLRVVLEIHPGGVRSKGGFGRLQPIAPCCSSSQTPAWRVHIVKDPLNQSYCFFAWVPGAPPLPGTHAHASAKEWGVLLTELLVPVIPVFFAFSGSDNGAGAVVLRLQGQQQGSKWRHNLCSSEIDAQAEDSEIQASPCALMTCPEFIGTRAQAHRISLTWSRFCS